jgi:hypothetical protein
MFSSLDGKTRRYMLKNSFSSTVSSGAGVDQQQTESATTAVDASKRFNEDSGVCFNIIDSTFPLFSAYCSVLPQTTFSLPNFFGHQTKQEAHSQLLALKPALDSSCFNHLRMFACPLFFPPCKDTAVLPCSSFCRGLFLLTRKYRIILILRLFLKSL